jgi:hypothetical protein
VEWWRGGVVRGGVMEGWRGGVYIAGISTNLS